MQSTEKYAYQAFPTNANVLPNVHKVLVIAAEVVDEVGLMSLKWVGLWA
jgi:hypothetical protein